MSFESRIIGNFPRNTTTVLGIPTGKLNDLLNRIIALESNPGKIETPTGAIDGSNVIYTFTRKPNVIVVDQGRTLINGIGYSLDGTGLIATLDVAPTFSIFSI